MNRPTSTQLGAIAEILIANALMVHSGGRLSPFTAMADDDGIDLLVYDKQSGQALPDLEWQVHQHRLRAVA